MLIHIFSNGRTVEFGGRWIPGRILQPSKNILARGYEIGRIRAFAEGSEDGK